MLATAPDRSGFKDEDARRIDDTGDDNLAIKRPIQTTALAYVALVITFWRE
jgi:hypothetical protein